jgi:hypothetical protein
MAKNIFKKTLTKSNLNLAGMKDKYITVPKEQINPEEFFFKPPGEIKFMDKASKCYFLLPFKKEKNGEYRLSRLRAFFELKKASVEDQIIIEKKINKNKSVTYEIDLLKVYPATNDDDLYLFANELNSDEEAKMPEGGKKTVVVNRYERSNAAREMCINHWKNSCSVCKMEFEKVYGEIGKGFIHVHHLKPISQIGKTYKVDPIKDLIPICPNCHAMIHKKRPEPFKIEELKEKLIK